MLTSKAGSVLVSGVEAMPAYTAEMLCCPHLGGADELWANDKQILEALSVAVECCDVTYDREEWNKLSEQLPGVEAGRVPVCLYDDTGSCAGTNHRDYLVAVAEEYRRGGHARERSRKEAFYLDTDNLYVLSGSVNTLRDLSDEIIEFAGHRFRGCIHNWMGANAHLTPTQ